MTASFALDTQSLAQFSTFTPYLLRWDLTPDGEPFSTPSSILLPVKRAGSPAMLKIAIEEEEQKGGALMRWWDGDGAVRVLEYDESALLLERAIGKASLAQMARSGQDDEATRILCSVTAKLHKPRARPLPKLIPLAQWFRALEPGAAKYGDFLPLAAAIARELLANPQDVCVLHGDIHHDNILDAGARGWLAIDPKRLFGERGFDYANILRNPDFEIATAPGRLARQASIIAAHAKLDRTRLIKWVVALTGLSAAWILDDGNDPILDRAVGTIALELLQSPQ